MLGLSPGIRPEHPLHTMLPGLGGLPLPGRGGGSLPLPHPPQPPTGGGSLPLHNMLPNMWPFIWNHISK